MANLDDAYERLRAAQRRLARRARDDLQGWAMPRQTLDGPISTGRPSSPTESTAVDSWEPTEYRIICNALERVADGLEDTLDGLDRRDRQRV